MVPTFCSVAVRGTGKGDSAVWSVAFIHGDCDEAGKFGGEKISYAALLFDDGEEVGAVGGEAEEAVADGVAGGVERLVEVGEEVALLGGAGLGGVGGEVRGHGVVEEQVALRHVLAEVTLHHAGVDEVFEEGGGDGAGSGIGFCKLDKGD